MGGKEKRSMKTRHFQGPPRFFSTNRGKKWLVSCAGKEGLAGKGTSPTLELGVYFLGKGV